MQSASILSPADTNIVINNSKVSADFVMGSGENKSTEMISLLSDDEEDTITETLDVPDCFLQSAENLPSKVSDQ